MDQAVSELEDIDVPGERLGKFERYLKAHPTPDLWEMSAVGGVAGFNAPMKGTDKDELNELAPGDQAKVKVVSNYYPYNKKFVGKVGTVVKSEPRKGQGTAYLLRFPDGEAWFFKNELFEQAGKAKQNYRAFINAANSNQSVTIGGVTMSPEKVRLVLGWYNKIDPQGTNVEKYWSQPKELVRKAMEAISKKLEEGAMKNLWVQINQVRKQVGDDPVKIAQHLKPQYPNLSMDQLSHIILFNFTTGVQKSSSMQETKTSGRVRVYKATWDEKAGHAIMKSVGEMAPQRFEQWVKQNRLQQKDGNTYIGGYNDVYKVYALGMKEGFNKPGARAELVKKKCTRCKGTGSTAMGTFIACPECKGRGYVYKEKPYHSIGGGQDKDQDVGMWETSGETRECPDCKGSGSALGLPCKFCGGTGSVPDLKEQSNATS